MKTMKIWRIAFAMLAAFSLVSCSSGEPQWADPEAHEKREYTTREDEENFKRRLDSLIDYTSITF